MGEQAMGGIKGPLILEIQNEGHWPSEVWTWCLYTGSHPPCLEYTPLCFPPLRIPSFLQILSDQQQQLVHPPETWFIFYIYLHVHILFPP